MTNDRIEALHGILSLAGAVAGWKLWRTHPIIGAILGHGVGWFRARAGGAPTP